ncbi:MAG TPA: cell wall hydrolase [Rhizomicrobium sp.]|nr:cell wall hydrolase [Rhizomicrobium sp.]
MRLRDVETRCDRAAALAFTVVVATFSASIATVQAARGPGSATPAVETIVRDVPVARMVAAQLPAAPPATDARARLLADYNCLAEALYYEARGEGETGEKAVAEVIFRRLHAASYGNSICAVVYEGAARGRCQFSFACDGSRAKPRARRDWRAAETLAAGILAGEVRLDGITGGATFYHAGYVRPLWADRLERTAEIGSHIFYRPPARLAAVVLRASIW